MTPFNDGDQITQFLDIYLADAIEEWFWKIR